MPSAKSPNLILLELQIAAYRQKMQVLFDARGFTDSIDLAESIKLDEPDLLEQSKDKYKNRGYPKSILRQP